MARYQLPAPQSMYRDTGLVHNTTLFRQRYVQNMAADNTLAQAVLEMASLEADDETKQALIEKYNERLRNRAGAGNYHMQGELIAKDAREFSNEYKPISDQLARYTSLSTELDKRVGKDRMSSVTAEAIKNRALYNYKGIKRGIDGRVDPASEFITPNFVDEVDYNQMIIDEMKALKPTITDSRGMEVMLDENAQLIQEPDENNVPAYYLKQGAYRERIEPEYVREVVQSVLNRNEVDATIRQESDLANYRKSAVDPITTRMFATDEIDNILAKIDEDIEKLENKKNRTDDEDSELELRIAQIEDIEKKREVMDDLQLLNNIYTQSKKSDILQTNLIKYAGPSKEIWAQDYTEGARFNIDRKARYDNPAPLDTYIDAGQIVVDVFGGKTVKDKRLYKNEAEITLKGYITAYGDDFVSKAMTANTEKEVEDLMKLTPQLDRSAINQIISGIQTSQRTINFIDDQLTEAHQDVLGMDKTAYENEISQIYLNKSVKADEYGGNISGEHILNALIELGEIPQNANMKDALDYIRDKGTQIVGGSAYGAVSDYILTPRIANMILQQRGIDPKAKGKFAATDKNQSTTAVGFRINSIMEDYNKTTESNDKAIDKHLNTQITTDALLLTGYGDKTGATSKAFKDYFKSGRVPSIFMFQHEGKDLSFKELEEELGVLTIQPEQSGLLAVSRPDGEPMLSFAFKTEDGDIINKTTSAKTINNDVIREYINTNKYQVESLYRQGIRANKKKSWSPSQFDGSVTFHYNNPGKEIEIAGKIYTEAIGLQILSQIVEQKGILLY